jgi:hypothetical protein
MKYILFIVFAGFLLPGCKSNVAVKYNDMIVQEQNKVKAGMDETEPRLKNYFATFEYDSIVTLSTRMEAKIDSVIQKVKKEPAPKANQGENFKKAVLNYFDYLKLVYATYKDYGSQTSAEGRMYAGQDVNMLRSKEIKMFTDMLEAQTIFAKDNNFKIRNAAPNNSLAKK